jgi:hypothetical protein
MTKVVMTLVPLVVRAVTVTVADLATWLSFWVISRRI